MRDSSAPPPAADDAIREPPVWPSDRRTFVSLGLQCVVNAFVYSTYVARLPDIRDEAGLSIAAMGLVMTVGNLAGFAAMLPSDALSSAAGAASG